MEKHRGICALCGKEADLTFEHIPPKSAFNKTPTRAVSVSGLLKKKDQLPWDTKGVRYKNLQQGMGDYTLCQSCNNHTGEWYGEAYRQFANRAAFLVSQDIPNGMNSVEIKEVYPLRIIKQILSMFCSINRPGLYAIDELRTFVLDKEATGLDRTRYRVHMYFTKSGYRKCAPISSIIHLNQDKTVSSTVVSEITAAPLGFLLYCNPTDVQLLEGIDISSFADVGYDQVGNVTLPIDIREVNTWVPSDYRSRAEIIDTIEKNQRWEEGFVTDGKTNSNDV